MKKIIFVINSMEMGGIQKSLIELLNAINNKYDITLYCVKAGGECIDFLPQNINVIYGNKYALLSEQSIGEAKKSGFLFYFFRLVFSAFTKFFGKRLPAFLLTKMIGKIPGEYDLAISFAQPINSKLFSNLNNEITLNCCKAQKKATFVHCDFLKYGGNDKINRKLYKRFDLVAAVSNSVGQHFLKALPELKNKVVTVYNIVDNCNIVNLANENALVYSDNDIVTVARLSEEKGLIRCVPIFKKLIDEGFNISWHIVGGGPMENPLRDAIKSFGLEKNIILYGEQKNPYRFLKNARFLLLPSFHEAAPVVFFEAAALNIPVLTTNTLSGKELIEDRRNGVVCENNDEAIYNMLKTSLTNNIVYNCQANDSTLTIKQFDTLLKDN